MTCSKAMAGTLLAACLFVLPVSAEDPCSKQAPEVVVFDGDSGRVEFPHELHTDMQVPCSDCHHETDAAKLDMPHPEYFEDFWIQCETCHRTDTRAGCPQACSACHHGSPTTIADESLSSKVVIHEACWKCHTAGQGVEASQTCPTCHQQDVRSTSE